MEREGVEFIGDHCGDDDLGPGPFLTRDDVADGVERGTVLETDVGRAGVEVDTRQGHQAVGVIGGDGPGGPRWQRAQLGRRRDRPLEVAVTRRRERGDLHGALVLIERRSHDGIARVVEDEGAVQDQIVDSVGGPVRHRRCGTCHLEEHGSGHHGGALHPVICQERDDGGVELDFPRGMHAAHGLPQQRMHGGVVQILGGLRGLVPEPPVLPRVRGQREQASALPRSQDVPRHVTSLGVQAADARQQRAGVVVVAALGGQHRNALRACDLQERRRQHGMRAQLDEVGVTVLEHAAGRGFEQHRGADVLPPVRRARGVLGQLFTGDGRVQRNPRRSRRKSLEGGVQVVPDAVHVVRVIRHLDREEAVEDVGVVETAGDLVERIPVPGDGHREGAVDRRHRDALPELVECADRLHQPLGAEADGEHASQSRGALLQSAPVVDHLYGLLEGQQTGEMVGGDLTGAVSDHGIGRDAELRELRGQGDLYGEVGGLGDLRLGHPGVGLVASKFLQQRPIRVPGQLAVGAPDALGEDGEHVEQAAAHLPPLRAHAGADERELRRGR